jgi:outer membrane protein OmpA-like peptidoglycan-associated protein
MLSHHYPGLFEDDPAMKARAETVRDLMLKRQVAADKIKVDGKGEKEPIADNKTPEGRETNRRIEFIQLRSAS